MTTLTALVMVHNEEKRLAACLDRLRFADAIVVVLDKCTDASKAIAQQYTSHIIEGAWECEGARRNLGIEACPSDWIVEIDADEWVTPALGDEIRTTLANANADYYALPIDNYIGKRLVRHGWGGSFGRRTNFALFRKGHKTWGAQRVHPAVTFTGTRGHKLTHPLIHHVDDNLTDTVARLNRYSSLKAEDLQASGDIGTLLGNCRRFFSRFWRCYIRRQGYKEGVYGIVIALCAGLFPLLAYAKAVERQNYDAR